MSGIKKVCGFELVKIKRNKLMLAIVGVLLVVIFILPAVNYFCINKAESRTDLDRETVLAQYQRTLNEYEEYLAKFATKIDKGERKTFEDICLRLRFYIETGTVESDYLNSALLTTKYEGRENTGFMFYFTNISSFLLWALAIAAAAYLFVFEYHTQTLKNVLAGVVSRNKIFVSKLLMLLAFVTVVSLVLSLFALAFGLTQDNMLLVLHNGNYRAINAVTGFIAQSVAIYILALVLFSVSIFSGIILKNIAISIATPGVAYGVALLTYFAISDLIATNPAYATINYLDKLPIFSLQFHVGAFDWGFVVALSLHLVFSLFLLFFASKKFNKQDM